MTKGGAWLALVLLAGALLRFATLDAQSLWYDEAVTAQLLRMDLGTMLRAIPDSESTPPLYYALAWLWAQVFGTGEVGLRSLPALLGTATIAVAWALGARLGGMRARTFAAILVAFSPMLIWFSQEARAYALLTLLAALSALLWLRAVEQPRRAGPALAWGLVAALALATHYYAIFLVGPQALWLALRAPGLRERATALALPVAAGLALAPLALGQRANDRAAFIGDSSLLTRLAQLPKQFLVGYDAPLEPLLIALTALVALIGLGGLAALLARRPLAQVTSRARNEIALLAGLVGAALVLPVLAAIGGEDHLITRNVVGALPLVCVLVAMGLAAVAQARLRAALAAVTVACAAGGIVAGGVAGDPQLQRDDWRSAVRALGTIGGPRLIVATPDSALTPLRYYLPQLRRATPPSFTTAEIDYIALPVRLPGERPQPPRPRRPVAPTPQHTLVGRTDGETFTVLRWRMPAPRPEPIAPWPGLDGKPAALLALAAP
ncbi:MAG TPA: glycosyltransferase family 39 protein [Solirubrobacteraceae bacterium]|nr:glycosyltransferase family 39 protein [Solirubrobacteraceae bacterium]